MVELAKRERRGRRPADPPAARPRLDRACEIMRCERAAHPVARRRHRRRRGIDREAVVGQLAPRPRRARDGRPRRGARSARPTAATTRASAAAVPLQPRRHDLRRLRTRSSATSSPSACSACPERPNGPHEPWHSPRRDRGPRPARGQDVVLVTAAAGTGIGFADRATRRSGGRRRRGLRLPRAAPRRDRATKLGGDRPRPRRAVVCDVTRTRQVDALIAAAVEQAGPHRRAGQQRRPRRRRRRSST